MYHITARIIILQLKNEEYFDDHHKWNVVPVLDNEITQDEITESIKKLKENRSSADGWTPSMITKIHGTLIPLLVFLFNAIFQFASFPTKWTDNDCCICNLQE